MQIGQVTSQPIAKKGPATGLPPRPKPKSQARPDPIYFGFIRRYRGGHQWFSVVAICQRCVEPFVSEFATKQRYCDPCRLILKNERNNVYCHTARGKEVQRRYHNSPKGKMTKGRYRETPERMERRNQYERERYARMKRALPHVQKCVSLLCEGTFLWLPTGAQRKFCDECRKAFGLRRAS